MCRKIWSWYVFYICVGEVQCHCVLLLLGICFLCHIPPDERWPDRLSHVTYPETGTELRGYHLSAKGNSHSRTYSIQRWLLPKSHNNRVCVCVCAQEPFRWKITLPNQLLMESLSSGSGQSKAHNVPSPWNNGQSVAHNACRHHVDPDKI